MRATLFPTVLVLGMVLTVISKGFSAEDADSGTGSEYYSYAFGKVYTSIVADDALAKTPTWVDTAENPPVSLRKAISLADAKRDRLVHDTDRCQWRRESVTLEVSYEVKRPWQHPYWQSTMRPMIAPAKPAYQTILICLC